jgi:DNA polymerase sigma
MIVSFLQMKQRNILSPNTDKHGAVHGSSGSVGATAIPSWNLGTLLLEFFHLYGLSFNYYTVGISVEEGGKLLGKRKVPGADKQQGHNNARLAIV